MRGGAGKPKRRPGWEDNTSKDRETESRDGAGQ